jgi:hypothetical protein
VLQFPDWPLATSTNPTFPLSSQQRDTLYQYLHGILPKGGLSVKRKDGSNGLAEHMEKRLIKELLHDRGTTSRCGKGVVAVPKGLLLSMFYVTPYDSTRNVDCRLYSIPTRGGEININDTLLNNAGAQACGLRTILSMMSKAKIFVASVLGEINKNVHANGWDDFLAKRVGGSAKPMQKFHGCRIVPQAVDDQGTFWNNNNANGNELDELSKPGGKLTVVLSPMCAHEDSIGSYRDYFEAKSCFVVPGMSNGNLPFSGRGGAGANKFVVAREFLFQPWSLHFGSVCQSSLTSFIRCCCCVQWWIIRRPKNSKSTRRT